MKKIQNNSTLMKKEKLEIIRLFRVSLLNKIKALFRGYKWRKELFLLKLNAIRIQCCFRIYKAKIRVKREKNRKFYGPEITFLFIKDIIINKIEMKMRMVRCNENYRITCFLNNDINTNKKKKISNDSNKLKISPLKKIENNNNSNNENQEKIVKKIPKREFKKSNENIIIESFFYAPEISVFLESYNNYISSLFPGKKSVFSESVFSDSVKINNENSDVLVISGDNKNNNDQNDNNNKNNNNDNHSNNGTIIIYNENNNSNNNNNDITNNFEFKHLLIYPWQHLKVAEIILKNLKLINCITIPTMILKNKNNKFNIQKSDSIDINGTNNLRNKTLVLTLPPYNCTIPASSSFSTSFSASNTTSLPTSTSTDIISILPTTTTSPFSFSSFPFFPSPSILLKNLNDTNLNPIIENLKTKIICTIEERSSEPQRRLLNDQKGFINAMENKKKMLENFADFNNKKDQNKNTKNKNGSNSRQKKLYVPLKIEKKEIDLYSISSKPFLLLSSIIISEEKEEIIIDKNNKNEKSDKNGKNDKKKEALRSIKNESHT